MLYWTFIHVCLNLYFILTIMLILTLDDLFLFLTYCDKIIMYSLHVVINGINPPDSKPLVATSMESPASSVGSRQDPIIKPYDLWWRDYLSELCTLHCDEPIGSRWMSMTWRKLSRASIRTHFCHHFPGLWSIGGSIIIFNTPRQVYTMRTAARRVTRLSSASYMWRTIPYGPLMRLRDSCKYGNLVFN